MTKEEILKAIRNHTSEIKTCIVTLDYMIASTVGGYRTEFEGEIDSLKGMMDVVKSRADEIKSILNEWPEG